MSVKFELPDWPNDYDIRNVTDSVDFTFQNVPIRFVGRVYS